MLIHGGPDRSDGAAVFLRAGRGRSRPRPFTSEARMITRQSDSVTPRVVLGWREWVALPGLGIRAVRAKVDTGARSSALHVDVQWRFTEGGAPWVGFRLTPGAPGFGVIE